MAAETHIQHSTSAAGSSCLTSPASGCDQLVGENAIYRGQLCSFVETGTATLVSRNREEELQKVGREMNQPLINGNRVLMTILEVSVTYGIEGEVVKIVGFFDDGSNCSVIKNSLATKL